MKNLNDKSSLNLKISNNERNIPLNYEAERSLIGAILSNNKAFESIEDVLSSDDFADPLHKKIFLFIKKIIEKGQIADINTLKIFLENDLDLKENGGVEYLLKISENSLSIINSHHYGKIIRELSQRRQLIDFGTDIVNKSFSPTIDISAENLIENAEQHLFNLSINGKINSGPKKFDNILSETLTIAEKAYKKDDETIGIKTGLADFDKKIGGLHNSDLIIIAGRPSMGKTAFATNIAYNITKQKQTSGADNTKGNVLFFSLEMSSEQLATRILAESSSIPSEKIRTGNISKNDFQKVVDSSQELSNLSLFIDDTPALTISSIKTRSRRLKRKEGLDLIIVDYLQLVSGTSNTQNDNRVQEVSEITRGLKAIAKDLNVPVIALSQLSRKVEDREEKRPQLSDLRESGTIEQDSDLVVFLYREEYYLARSEPTEGTDKHNEWVQKMSAIHNIAEAIIAKHRHGPISKVKLHFNASSTKFSDFIDNSDY